MLLWEGKKKEKDKDEKRDIFYWSEGSVAIGRVGDTSISSTKEINTNRITVGADRFIDDKALRGLAFSVGRSNVDVGNMGSNVDADTYNLTYYSTSPMKDDEKFVDTIIGIGKIVLNSKKKMSGLVFALIESYGVNTKILKIKNL